MEISKLVEDSSARRCDDSARRDEDSSARRDSGDPRVDLLLVVVGIRWAQSGDCILRLCNGSGNTCPRFAMKGYPTCAMHSLPPALASPQSKLICRECDRASYDRRLRLCKEHYDQRQSRRKPKTHYSLDRTVKFTTVQGAAKRACAMPRCGKAALGRRSWCAEHC